MTDRQEFNAATVEEAVEKASMSVGLPAEKLSYEVLDPGSPGFLGIGARDARIAVTTEAADEPAVEERSEPSFPEDHEAGAELPRESSDTTADSDAHSPVPDELLGEIERFVSQIVEAMGFEARINVYDAGEFVAVDVNTGETGLFIGQKGETIDALQYLINVSIYKNRPFAKRIIVDSEGYRQRRIEAVQGVAHRMARKAVRESRLVELPPMNSAERRVVHVFLKDNPAVNTTSEGSGEDRRVTISPIH
jgi:spoIIIJ-associated protein